MTDFVDLVRARIESRRRFFGSIARLSRIDGSQGPVAAEKVHRHADWNIGDGEDLAGKGSGLLRPWLLHERKRVRAASFGTPYSSERRIWSARLGSRHGFT